MGNLFSWTPIVLQDSHSSKQGTATKIVPTAFCPKSGLSEDLFEFLDSWDKTFPEQVQRKIRFREPWFLAANGLRGGN